MLINASNQAYLLEVLVTVDVLLVMRVLQFVGFDILPEGLNDTGASLCVYAEQTSQTWIQLKLRWLQQDKSIDAYLQLISFSFNILFS